MEKNDSVFGKLTYDYFWFKHDQVMFFGRLVDIVIMISGEEGEEIEQGQNEAYEALLNDWENIHKSFLEYIFKYYKEKRHELGYDIEFNENYPIIDTYDEMLKNIQIVGINIPYAEVYGGRSIGITFDCTWDTENGLGLRLSNERVIKVGYQDVAI